MFMHVSRPFFFVDESRHQDSAEGAVLISHCEFRSLAYRTVKRREGWVLLKIPRGDIDGVGEVK